MVESDIKYDTVSKMSKEDRKPTRGRGRPRAGAADEAILGATLALLGEEGYSRMSVDSVAARAGVTKPTIYRRWPSKADLATAALSRLQRQEAAVGSGSPRGRLIAHLRGFQRSLLRPNGMAMIGTLLVEERHNPELLELFRRRVVRHRRSVLRAILEEAASEGMLKQGADLDAAVNLLVGSFYARYLTGEGVPRDWARRVVDCVWKGIAAMRER
jgi:AcrR family transcriptional regulator